MSSVQTLPAASRRTSVTTLLALTLISATACASIQVRTTQSPDANMSSLRSFAVAAPSPTSNPATGGGNDPMLANSISNRALRQALTADFAGRGYALDSVSPGFVVAYYASARTKLDISQFDFGYPFWGHGWWRGDPGYPLDRVSAYTEGTVIVDVLASGTKDLLWRGQGKSEVSDDPAAYATQLSKTVKDIVSRFPAAGSAGPQEK